MDADVVEATMRARSHSLASEKGRQRRRKKKRNHPSVKPYAYTCICFVLVGCLIATLMVLFREHLGKWYK